MTKEEFKKIEEQSPMTCPVCRERWFALFDRVYIAEYGRCFMCDDLVGEGLDTKNFDERTRNVMQIIDNFNYNVLEGL